jgi:hypothetical protein
MTAPGTAQDESPVPNIKVAVVMMLRYGGRQRPAARAVRYRGCVVTAILVVTP